MNSQSSSINRESHQTWSSSRAMKWFWPMNRADSLFCRPKARTTRIPPNTSVVWLSISWRSLRTSRNKRADAAVPEQVGIINARHQQKCPQQEPPVDPGEDDHSAQKLDDGLPGVVEHAEDQLADAAGILAQQAGCAARLELVDPMQGQAHRVFVDLAADRDLNSLGRPGGLPAAREPQELAQHRDNQDQAPPGRPGVPWEIQAVRRGSTPRPRPAGDAPG